MQLITCIQHLDPGSYHMNSFDEDYRWQIWRDQLPTWLFQLFHLGFIGESFLSSTTVGRIQLQ